MFIEISDENGILFSNVPDNNSLYSIEIPETNIKVIKKVKVKYFYDKEEDIPKKILNVKFTSCGMLWWWSFAIANRLDFYKAYCVSGGVLAACLSICGLKKDFVLNELNLFYNKYKINRLGRNVLKALEEWLLKILPDNAHILCSGRLVTFIRSLPLKTLAIEYYESNEFLVECMITACSIPGICVPFFGKKFKETNNCCDYMSNPKIENIDYVFSPFHDTKISLKLIGARKGVKECTLLYEKGMEYDIDKVSSIKNDVLKKVRAVWRIYDIIKLLIGMIIYLTFQKSKLIYYNNIFTYNNVKKLPISIYNSGRKIPIRIYNTTKNIMKFKE
jgi:hypothetical protein